MQPKMIFFIFWSITTIKINIFSFWLNLKRNFSICQSFKETKNSIICTAPLADRFVGAARENHHRDVKKVQMFLQDPLRGWLLQAASPVLCQPAGQQPLPSLVQGKPAGVIASPKLRRSLGSRLRTRETPEPKHRRLVSSHQPAPAPESQLQKMLGWEKLTSASFHKLVH